MMPLIGSLLMRDPHFVGIIFVVSGCLSTIDIIPQKTNKKIFIFSNN